MARFSAIARVSVSVVLRNRTHPRGPEVVFPPRRGTRCRIRGLPRSRGACDTRCTRSSALLRGRALLLSAHKINVTSESAGRPKDPWVRFLARTEARSVAIGATWHNTRVFELSPAVTSVSIILALQIQRFLACRLFSPACGEGRVLLALWRRKSVASPTLWAGPASSRHPSGISLGQQLGTGVRDDFYEKNAHQRDPTRRAARRHR